MIHSNDLFIFMWDNMLKGFIKIRIHGIRPIHPINFSPMTHEYMKQSGYMEKYIQVSLTNFLFPGTYWITVCKHQIKNYRMEI